MNDCNVVLWGGTGQAKVVADIIGMHRIDSCCF